ncbi:MAG: hypothetical protein V5A32_09515, partial [Halovenus sp.]
VSYAFALAASVLFPMFFLGLWWENTNRQGALAGMITGLVLWFVPMINEGNFGLVGGGDGIGIAVLETWMPAIGSALIIVPIVFAVTIFVSIVTDEPPEKTKMMVRQCHSPDPMGKDVTAAEVVERKISARETAADGGETATDGGEPATDGGQPVDTESADAGSTADGPNHPPEET